MISLDQITRLTQAVASWLNFQIYCGRETLLSEDYLSQPLAEFLTPLFPNRIEAEWTANQFRRGGRGRPRQIDYVAKSRDSEHPVTAIEAKWIAGPVFQKQRIVDDILRLEMLRVANEAGRVRYTQRLFLLAGTVAEMETALGAIIRDGGNHEFFPLFLPVTNHPTRVAVRECASPIRPYFKHFAQGYNVRLPTTYNVELKADNSLDLVRVMVWQVASSRRRSEFDALALWRAIEVPDSDVEH